MGKNKQLFGPIILNNKLITKVQNDITNIVEQEAYNNLKVWFISEKLTITLFSRFLAKNKQLYIKISNSGGHILGKNKQLC